MSMPKLRVRLGFAALAFGLTSVARAQEHLPIPSPTAEHKVLAADEGIWDATVKAYPNGPESEPMVARGVEINSVIPGGLWVSSTFQSDLGGMKYEGRGQFGYDPMKKKYVGSWIDSMSPNLTVLEGCYDSKTRTLEFKGDGVCPRDGSQLAQRMVTTTKGDGSREFTLYVTGTPTGGKEAKVMQIHYTRRK